MTNAAIFQNGLPEPCPDSFNIAQYVLNSALKTPDKSALEVLSAPGLIAEHWTFAELAQAVQGTATGLAQAGLNPGQKIVLRVGHRSDFPILFLAAITIGAIPIPTSAQLTPPEIDAILADLGDVFGVVQDETLDPPSAKTRMGAADDVDRLV